MTHPEIPELFDRLADLLKATVAWGPEAVEGLAVLATAPLGQPARTPDGLELPSLTRLDRAMGVNALVMLALRPDLSGPTIAARAREMLATPAVSEARASIMFATMLHGDLEETL